MSHAISDAALQAVAEAIFKEASVVVVEAYSDFGQELRRFATAQALCAFAQTGRNASAGSLHLAVHYPDMAGEVLRTRVALDASQCQGHDHRYQTQGWGLIWVYLQLGSKGMASFISANTEKRAQAWQVNYPELGAPQAWHWPAVARHLRRLRAALKSGSAV